MRPATIGCLCVTVGLLAAGLLAGTLARGEQVQDGNVRISFDADFKPHALPRDRPVPVFVSFSGKVSAVNGQRPPRVKRISIAFNRHGRISTDGLPVCEASQLQSVTTREALERCRGALLGRGRFDAHVDFPDRGFSVQGAALAFNGVQAGRSAILLHVYSTAPIQSAVVLVMKLSHPTEGQFGTVLSTKVPKIAGGAGYLTGMRLNLDRRYRVDGSKRSFLSASCAAPAGFPGAVFTLARGSFYFGDGQRSTVSLTRSCSVRAR